MPQVLVLSPDDNSPIGGIRVLYRHVDILNKHGISAAVLHMKRGFRCTWFKNSTPVVHYSPQTLAESEFIVLPEIYGAHAAREVVMERKDFLGIRRKVRLDVSRLKKVILNQNAHYTFDHHPLAIERPETPYLSPDVRATFVVSEHNRAFVQSVFPQHPVHRIHLGINHDEYYYEPKKKKQIAFMPRKNFMDIQRVINGLKFKGALKGWTLAPIDGLMEPDVARIMRESAFFLTFGTIEGFQLPPAEAMMCGCIVAGYHGYGAQEFMLPELSFPVQAHDSIGFITVMEKLLKEYDTDPSALQTRAKTAAEYMSERYTHEEEEADIIGAWRRILG